MADTKLSDLTALAVEPADTDEFYINDGGTSKKIAWSVLKSLFLREIVSDTTPQLGGALDGQGHDLNNLGVAFLTEQAAAEADVAGKGQHWVKTATPNRAMFTDDAGTDFEMLEVIYSAHVTTVANQEYAITFDAPFAGTITTMRTKTESGTCTVTGEIDDVSLGGTANSASSTAQEQAHASANTYAKGAKIAFTVSSNSSAVDLEVIMYGYRTS